MFELQARTPSIRRLKRKVNKDAIDNKKASSDLEDLLLVLLGGLGDGSYHSLFLHEEEQILHQEAFVHNLPNYDLQFEF